MLVKCIAYKLYIWYGIYSVYSKRIISMPVYIVPLEYCNIIKKQKQCPLLGHPRLIDVMAPMAV